MANSSFVSIDSSFFDIEECTARVDAQRAILRLQDIHPAQLKDICEHLYFRETFEKGTSSMELEDIVETRFDKLLQEIINTNYDKYQDRSEVRAYPCFNPISSWPLSETTFSYSDS